MIEQNEPSPKEENGEHPLKLDEFQGLLDVWKKSKEAGARAVSDFLDELDDALKEVHEQGRQYLIMGTIISTASNLMFPNLMTSDSSFATVAMWLGLNVVGSAVALKIKNKITQEIARYKEEVASGRSFDSTHQYQSEDEV